MSCLKPSSLSIQFLLFASRIVLLSRASIFFQAGFSHGLMSTTCQTGCSFNTVGFAESGVQKGLTLTQGARAKDGTAKSSPLTQRTPSANARYSPAYFWTKSTYDRRRGGTARTLSDRGVRLWSAVEGPGECATARGRGEGKKKRDDVYPCLRSLGLRDVCFAK